jgi:DNA invertase Pin-like site-specific DNA recombinase
LLTRGAIMKRAIIYVRVSTGEQNLDMQLKELPEYIQRRGWELVDTYSDKITGAKDRRPGLDRLMADARKRRFDVVVVWKFDRFARSTSHLLRALEEFQALTIDFVSLHESVDTSTPMGKMVFTVLGAVAELERSTIAERCAAGRRAAVRRGVKFGRPALQVNVSKVRDLRQSGLSLRAIGAKLGVSHELVRQALV